MAEYRKSILRKIIEEGSLENERNAKLAMEDPEKYRKKKKDEEEKEWTLPLYTEEF